MKQWITLFAVAAIFTACSKDNLLQDENLQQPASTARTAAMHSTQEGAYLSDWEQYSAWSKTDNGSISKFSMMRKTPEVNSGVTNGGLVLSYAKISTTNPDYSSFNSPRMMPYYFLPSAERPNPYTNYFFDESSDGNIVVNYQVPFTKQDLPTMSGGASLQNYQFQYVVLTKAFLDSHGLDAQTVKNYYTYDQVMSLVNP